MPITVNIQYRSLLRRVNKMV